MFRIRLEARRSRVGALIVLAIVAATMAIMPVAAGTQIPPSYTVTAGAACTASGAVEVSGTATCTGGCPGTLYGQIEYRLDPAGAWQWLPGTIGLYPLWWSSAFGGGWPDDDPTIYVRARASLDGIGWPPGQFSPEVAITQPVCTGNIIVDKVTNPSGSAQLFGFNPSWSESNFLLADGSAPDDSGPIPVGGYSVAEIVPPGWLLDQAVCEVEAPDNEEILLRNSLLVMSPDDIELGPGQTVYCTFYNEAQGRIIVNKAVSPEGAPLGLFTFTPSWGPAFVLAGGGSHDSGLMPTGIYSVAEMAPLAEGWSLASATCDDGSSPAAIGLSPDETVTCTFTNRYQQPEGPGGSLTIEKATTPAGGTGFGFAGTLGAFSLDDGGSMLFDGLATGPYTVTETPAAGWEFEDVVCSTEPGAAVDYMVVGSGVTVNLAEGQDVTCRFTNGSEDVLGPEGSLTIIKHTVPAGGTGFEFDAGDLGAFTLDDGGSRVFTDLAAGAYTVIESPAEDWAFASIECDALDFETDGASVTVNLAEGEVAVCTFTNGELPFTGGSAFLVPMLFAGLAALLMGFGAWMFGTMRGAKA